MAKIAFVRVAHKDYQNSLSMEKALKSLEILKKIEKLEILFNDEPLVDPVEAQTFGKKITSENVDGVVIFFDTWSDPSIAMAILLEVKHLPIALWGFQMFEINGKFEQTGSFVGLTVFASALKRLEINFKYINGFSDEINVQEKIKSFINVSQTLSKLRSVRLGLVGYSAMSIYSGTFDHLLLRGLIGPEVVQIDSYSLINIAESCNEKQVNLFSDNIKKYANISADLNNKYIEKAGRLYYAIKKIISDFRINSINIKCQYEFSQEWECIPCVPLSLIAEEGIVTSCEGDVLTSISQIILNLLTNQIVTYADLLNIDENVAYFSACGFAPFSLAQNPGKSEIRDINTPGFCGPISSIVLKKGSLTFMRLNEEKGNYFMCFGTGEGLDSELRQGRFPALRVQINGDSKNLINAFGAQHYAICYDDITDQLIDLCSLLNIKYINVK